MSAAAPLSLGEAQLTNMETAAIAVPPVATNGSKMYSVSTVGRFGNFW